MENEEDPNIKLLESLNFQEVKIKKVNSKLIYDNDIQRLYINTTVEEIPTSNNIIIDIEKFYDIYIDALYENETTQEDYEDEEKEHETTFYFYIAVDLDNLISYRLYLKNMNSLINKGITDCFINFNNYYYEREVPNPNIPSLQEHNFYTIKEIVNNYNVPDAIEYQFALSSLHGDDYTTDFNNNALFFNVSQNVINQEIIINKEIIEKKNKKSYDFLLAYFLHHEQKHIINLLL